MMKNMVRIKITGVIITLLTFVSIGYCEEYQIHDIGNTQLVIVPNSDNATIHKQGSTEVLSDQFGNIATKRRQGSIEIITTDPHREFTEKAKTRTHNAHQEAMERFGMDDDFDQRQQRMHDWLMED